MTVNKPSKGSLKGAPKFAQRSIRVFLSSTFKDMMEEREHLMKVIFPELRRMCKQRFVTLTEVDLRWGILPEESEDGKVIDICLSEIDKSRPYFIGLLGNRYGWIPSPEEYEKHSRIIEAFPWVKEDIEHELSITEMEIQYGVLRNPEMKGRALFFLKSVPDSAQTEKKTPQLERLKAEIRAQQNHPVAGYSSVEEMGKMVQERLWEMIEADFPESQIPDKHQREKLDQYCISKDHLALYENSADQIEQLSEQLAPAGKVIVYGGPGQGKSALLANWSSQKNGDITVISYLCGSTASSTRVLSLVRFLAEEIKRTFDISLEIPARIEDPGRLLRAFCEAVPSEEIVCLVLDGIDRLEPLPGEENLLWLPHSFPENVRIILSTRLAGQVENLQTRGFAALEIEPLAPAAVKNISREYFEGFSKKLSENLLDRIGSAPINQNPSVLLSLLNEIRLFGSFEDLEDQVTLYSDQATPDAFFLAFLNRLEQDYPVGEFRQDLILPALLMTADGLTEEEILAFSGIKRLNWSILFNVLNYHLIDKNGLLQINNSFLAEAIRKKYLPSVEAEQKIRKALIDYFEATAEYFNLITDKAEMARFSRELPDLLLDAGEDELLSRHLQFLPLFELIFEDEPNRLGKYLAAIRRVANPSVLLMEAIGNMERSGMHPDRQVRICYYIGDALLQHDSPENAIPAYFKALEIFNLRPGNPGLIIPVLKELAICYERLGDLAAATRILVQVLPYETEESKAEILDQLSHLYGILGAHSQAALLCQDALDYSRRRFGNHSLEVAVLYHNLGLIYARLKDMAAARQNYLAALDIALRIGGKQSPLYLTIQSSLAVLALSEPDLEDSWQRYWTVYQIRKETLGSSHPLTLKSMNGMGVCKSLMGNFAEAEGWLELAWTGQKKVLGENHRDTLITLGNYADVFLRQENYEKAGELQQQIYQAFRQNYGPVNEQSINAGLSLANILFEQGEPEAAIKQYQEILPAVEQFYGTEHQMTFYIRYKISEIGVGIREATEEDLTAFLEWYLFKARNFQKEESWEAAESYFEKVLELSKQSEKGIHPAYFSAVEGMSALLFRLERYREAASYCSLMVEQAGQVLGKDSDVYLRYQTLKAYNLFKEGDWEPCMEIVQEIGENLPLLQEKVEPFALNMYQEMVTFFNRFGDALNNYAAHEAEVNERVNSVEAQLDSLYQEANEGNLDECLQKVELLIEEAEELNQNYGQTLPRVYLAKALFLEHQEKYEEAIQALFAGIRMVTTWEETYSVNTERFTLKIGEILSELAQFEQAVEFLQRARRANQGWQDYPNEGTIEIYSALIILLRELGRAQECLHLIGEIIPVVQKIKGEEDPFLEDLNYVKNELSQPQS